MRSCELIHGKLIHFLQNRRNPSTLSSSFRPSSVGVLMKCKKLTSTIAITAVASRTGHPNVPPSSTKPKVIPAIHGTIHAARRTALRKT